MRLVKKWREGSRWIRRHDRAQTAYERLLASQQLRPKERLRLRDYFQSLDPFELAQKVEGHLKPILKLAKQHIQEEK